MLVWDTVNMLIMLLGLTIVCIEDRMFTRGMYKVY